jgi:hypothetical protein
MPSDYAAIARENKATARRLIRAALTEHLGPQCIIPESTDDYTLARIAAVAVPRDEMSTALTMSILSFAPGPYTHWEHVYGAIISTRPSPTQRTPASLTRDPGASLPGVPSSIHNASTPIHCVSLV